jgi:hypothetical protein
MRLFLLCCCGLLIGCASGSPFEYEKVSGKITYEDGTPIPGGGLRLRFISQDAAPVDQAYPRPAFANVDAQGVFDYATSYKHGDGLIPGKHKVSLERDSDLNSQPAVPKEYLSINTTPLIVDTADAPFKIKVPKSPAGRAK